MLPQSFNSLCNFWVNFLLEFSVLELLVLEFGVFSYFHQVLHLLIQGQKMGVPRSQRQWIMVDGSLRPVLVRLIVVIDVILEGLRRRVATISRAAVSLSIDAFNYPTAETEACPHCFLSCSQPSNITTPIFHSTRSRSHSL